jgi:hypothetical protein
MSTFVHGRIVVSVAAGERSCSDQRLSSATTCHGEIIAEFTLNPAHGYQRKNG